MQAIPKFSALTIIAAVVGFVAILANTFFGSDQPNTKHTVSKPMASALSYLQARPFDALAFVGYAQTPESQSDVTLIKRERALNLASLLAPNDPDVAKTLAAFAFQRGNALQALNDVARWATVAPYDRAKALNILLSAAGTQEWESFIQGQLKTNWPLTGELLSAACGKLGGNQLLALATAVSRNVSVSSQTAACVSIKLIADNRSADARAYWLGTLRPLPPKIGHVFNGDFSLPVGDSPFNWLLAEGGEFRDGFRVGLASGAAPDGKARALLVRFNGRKVNSALATQSLALSPGNYRLRYSAKQSGFVGTESARWLVRCGPIESMIEQRAEPTQAMPDGWRKHVEIFTVTNLCKSQTIRLELSSRLQQLTGINATAAFADIELERINI